MGSKGPEMAFLNFESDTFNHSATLPTAYLPRLIPLTEIYFARLRVGGKLIRQSLNAKPMGVTKFKLTDLEKEN